LISLERLKIIDGRLVPSRILVIASLTLLLAMMHSVDGTLPNAFASKCFALRRSGLTKLQVSRGRRHAAKQRWI